MESNSRMERTPLCSLNSFTMLSIFKCYLRFNVFFNLGKLKYFNLSLSASSYILLYCNNLVLQMIYMLLVNRNPICARAMPIYAYLCRYVGSYIYAKLEREVLLTLQNQKYNETKKLFRWHTNARDWHKNQLPIHIILRAKDFAKIKMGTCPRVGQIGELFAEQTRMGSFIMSGC